MTPQAVRLLVARNTTLQVLSSGLRMAQDPESLVVVEGGDDFPLPAEAEIQVALSAEGLGAVTGRAVAHSSVGFRAMRGQEVEGMEGGGAGTVVAIEAGILGVAGGAIQLSGGGLRRVGAHEIFRMKTSCSLPGELDSAGSILRRNGKGQDGVGKVCGPAVAGEAGAAVMTNGAVPHGGCGQGTVSHLEIAGLVAFRGREVGDLQGVQTGLAHGNVTGPAGSRRLQVSGGIRGVTS